jgi:hypothetical protein
VPEFVTSTLPCCLGAPLFVPGTRKIALNPTMVFITPLVEKWWKDKCRVTACASNVVTLDGVSFPVQWLEEVLHVFHRQFLDSSPAHYYSNELIVRGVQEPTMCLQRTSASCSLPSG